MSAKYFKVKISLTPRHHTDKKEKKIFLIYKEIKKEAVAKSYITKGLLIYCMTKNLRISSYTVQYKEALSLI